MHTLFLIDAPLEETAVVQIYVVKANPPLHQLVCVTMIHIRKSTWVATALSLTRLLENLLLAAADARAMES